MLGVKAIVLVAAHYILEVVMARMKNQKREKIRSSWAPLKKFKHNDDGRRTGAHALDRALHATFAEYIGGITEENFKGN